MISGSPTTPKVDFKAVAAGQYAVFYQGQIIGQVSRVWRHDRFFWKVQGYPCRLFTSRNAATLYLVHSTQK